MTQGGTGLVTVSGVSLSYTLAVDRPASLKEYAVKRARRDLRRREVLALQDVSFEVVQGEVFAVVGANGAGKSTLMKLIARVLPPTSGRVVVRGSVAPMIELGAGFNGELSGAENVVLYGALLGRDPDDMRRRVDEIADWAELTEAIHTPLRTYSTGMVARLGFSVATSAVPDLLVVDEILSVGDASFQAKSKARMRELIASGTSVVLVSHDLKTVADLADRTLWLHQGRVRELGPPELVLPSYTASA